MKINQNSIFKNGVSLSKLAVATATVVLFFLWQGIQSSRTIDFNTEIKPIFNQHCMACHGGVKTAGGFSLLTREEALQPTDSGKPAIVPGNAAASELIRRIWHHDPELRMPYLKPPLPTASIELIEKWVEQGANWGLHWAYQPVRKPKVPSTETSSFFSFLNFFNKNNTKLPPNWAKNDIDHFIAEKWKSEELTPNPAADPRTLLRRVALDLTGLPAPEHLAKQFLNDFSEKTYENLVDSLLAQPTFGERWASVWLDLARYADSKGYERDGMRLAWRYRDWLIRAFNQDMPYDQFLTEQLAGDLLPQPTDAQRIATTFHRNTPTNDEGGTDNEEYRVAAVLDRVNTTWEGILGTTFACVQCHSHPYDPFFHEEYYQFAAFFNNSRDFDTYDDFPLLRIYSGEDSLRWLRLDRWLRENATPAEHQYFSDVVRLWQPARYSIEADSLVNAAHFDTKWLAMCHPSSARMPAVRLDGMSSVLVRQHVHSKGGSVSLRLDRPDGKVLLKIPLTQTTQRLEVQKFDFQPVVGTHHIYVVYENPALARQPDHFGWQLDWLIFLPKFPANGKAGYSEAQQDFLHLVTTGCETVPVMFENPTDFLRKNYLFERGSWLSPGKEVQPGTPRYLPPMATDSPKNRLGMAQWLTSAEHPLTARVMVNRLWEQIFGQGLVETLEDFGSQGTAPTHPELLDWMAWQFVHEHRWSIKKMLRQLVLSATYRQSSEISPEKLEKDPKNRWLARSSRLRLNAEQIRDQALAVSGLLSSKMYGKSVMPFQPDGIWQVPYNGSRWQQSTGEDQHRRAIYTFIKRSSPYPTLMTFDGAARQVCTARRVRTNTPLQALATLNDPVFVECAQHFAKKIVEKLPHASPTEQLAWAYEHASGRQPTPEKLAVLIDLWEKTEVHFASKPAEVSIFLKFLSPEMHRPDVAALSVACNVLLNLDEVLTRW